MKKFLLGVSVVAMCFWESCSKSDVADEGIADGIRSKIKAELHEPDSLSYETTFEADRMLLEELGFDVSDMTEFGDFYAVGEEYLFRKTTLSDLRQSPRPRLNYGWTLTPENQHIYLRATDFVGFPVQADFIEAVEAWNTIGQCNLNFSTDFDAKPATDRVKTAIWISSNPPFGITDLIKIVDPLIISPGQPATDLILNTSHRLWPQHSNEQIKYLIMHGLGHVVGLKDYTGELDDFNSIMQPASKLQQTLSPWSGFSEADKQALRKKYPLIVIPDEPQFEISSKPALAGADEDKLVVGTQYTFTADYTNPAVPNPVYAFSVEKLDNQVRYEFKAGAGNTCTLKITTPGKLRLKVKIVHNGAEKNVYQRYYSGYINKFEHPSKPELETFYDFKWNFWDVDYPDYTVNFWVEEKYFDQGSDISTTIERVDNGHVRIRFDEYGGYKVVAELRTGPHLIERKEYIFTKLYRPFTTSFSRVSATSEPFRLPEYATEPTGFHPMLTEIWNVNFGTSPTLEGRVVCNVHKKAIQNTLISRITRSVDHRIIDRGTTYVVLDKGASSAYQLPPVYEMYDPYFVNYEFHYCAVKEYYSSVSYPERDAAYLR